MRKISRKKSTFWNLVFSYSTVLYGVISGFILVPLYLVYIPVELYGAWLASGSVLNWLSVVDPGLSTIVTQRVGKSYGSGNLEAVFAYAFWGILITTCIIAFVMFLGFEIAIKIPFWTRVSEGSGFAEELQNNFMLAVLATSLTLMAFAVGSVNIGMQATFINGINYLSANILSLLATVILLFLDAGLWAITIGLLIRAIVFLVGGLLCMCRLFFITNITPNIKIKYAKDIFSLMSFTSIGRIGEIITKNADAILIARFVGVQSVPVYMLSQKGFSVAEMLLNRMAHGLSPSLSHLDGEAGKGRKVNEVVLGILMINIWMLPLAFIGFFTLNESFIKLWVGNEFFVGNAISTLMCCLFMFSTLSTLMFVVCVALGDIKNSAIIRFFQSIVILTLLFAGLYYIGLIGAVLAPLVGYLCFSVWYFPISITKLAKITKTDWHFLSQEIFYSTCTAILTFFIVNHIMSLPLSWTAFIAFVFVTFFIYFIMLTFLSSELKGSLSTLISYVFKRMTSSGSN